MNNNNNTDNSNNNTTPIIVIIVKSITIIVVEIQDSLIEYSLSNYGHTNFVHSIIILGLGERGGLAVWSPQTASAPSGACHGAIS